MNTPFALHTQETAPVASQSLLQSAKANYGFVPNLFAGMAESPQLLEAYLATSAVFNQTELNDTEKQVVMMTVNRLNDCTYCMAAHSMVSTMSGVAPDVLQALRAGTPIADAKLEALRLFTVRMVESRGWPSEQDLHDLYAAGYGRRTAMDVVLGIGLKLMSNYAAAMADTPLDTVFAPHAWSATPHP